MYYNLTEHCKKSDYAEALGYLLVARYGGHLTNADGCLWYFNGSCCCDQDFVVLIAQI